METRNVKIWQKFLAAQVPSLRQAGRQGWVGLHESTGSTGAAGWGGMVSKLPSEDKATMSCALSKKEIEIWKHENLEG